MDKYTEIMACSMLTTRPVFNLEKFNCLTSVIQRVQTVATYQQTSPSTTPRIIFVGPHITNVTLHLTRITKNEDIRKELKIQSVQHNINNNRQCKIIL